MVRNTDDVYRKASKSREFVGEEERETETEKRQDIGRMMGRTSEHAYRRTRRLPLLALSPAPNNVLTPPARLYTVQPECQS
jgi:hypothetical protein